ncbi:MAG: UDP-N-acetylmuramoyl-L-alanyl-D-glutamate--2,6-diaminopimelate ligase [bacterium]
MIKDIVKKYIPSFVYSWYHFLVALIAATVYQYPSRKLKVIGVTGTNGKSTVVMMVSKILEEAGYRVSYFSSIESRVDNNLTVNRLRMTMPGPFILQRFLRDAVNARTDYAIVEVTSEGIKMHRHRFINFKTAVLTNLSPEHIESHGSYGKYRQAKLKLFKIAKRHIINIDDNDFTHFWAVKASEKIGYSLYKSSRQLKIIKADNPKEENGSLFFTVNGHEFKMGLIGLFNIYNALAAIAVGLSEGVDVATCQIALSKVQGIPGRMEEVISSPFKVIVDYAFTPNALSKVYENIKPKNNRLICVLGACGGGRDKWKRPVLGEIASRYCDQVIVTNEDPYDENPEEIINQVIKGTAGKGEKIVDRRKAISSALRSAKKGDVVIITGKGCEPSICLANNEKISWDDRQIVKEEYSKIVKTDAKITN